MSEQLLERSYAERVRSDLEQKSFALNKPDKAFPSAPQGCPDGALTRGLDRPARTPEPLAYEGETPTAPPPTCWSHLIELL